MAEKRTYTAIVASLETHIEHMSNHLGNIDQHLNRQNEALTNHAKSITKNGTWIAAFKWVVGIIFTALIIVATHAFGVW